MRIYERNGKKYLSVTSVISLMFGFDSEGFNRWASENHLSADWITKTSADLGSKYHAYFENRANGISEWADVVSDKFDKGYKKAVEDFFAQGWEILESEQEVFCNEYRFAGRFDLVIRNKGLGISRAIGDIKTWGAWKKRMYKPNKDKLKKLSNQLSMYAYALGEDIPMFLIVPQKNGKCVVEKIEKTNYWKDWIDANSKEVHKLLQA